MKNKTWKLRGNKIVFRNYRKSDKMTGNWEKWNKLLDPMFEKPKTTKDILIGISVMGLWYGIIKHSRKKKCSNCILKIKKQCIGLPFNWIIGCCCERYQNKNDAEKSIKSMVLRDK